MQARTIQVGANGGARAQERRCAGAGGEVGGNDGSMRGAVGLKAVVRQSGAKDGCKQADALLSITGAPRSEMANNFPNRRYTPYIYVIY